MMNPIRRPSLAGLVVGVVAVLSVTVVSLHRAGLYALPGDRIIVWFPAVVATDQALQRIGQAGAMLHGPGPWSGAYRVYVRHPSAPRALAERASVLRDPVEGLAQCFGFVHPGIDGAGG